MASFSPGASILGPPPIFHMFSNSSTHHIFSNSTHQYQDFVHCLIPRQSISFLSQNFLKNQILDDGIRLASVIVNLSSSFLRSTQSTSTLFPHPSPSYFHPPTKHYSRNKNSGFQSKNRRQQVHKKPKVSKIEKKSSWIWQPKKKSKEVADNLHVVSQNPSNPPPEPDFNLGSVDLSVESDLGLVDKLAQSSSSVQSQLSPSSTLNIDAAPFVPQMLPTISRSSDQELIDKVQFFNPKVMTSLDDSSRVEWDHKSAKFVDPPPSHLPGYYISKTLDDVNELKSEGFKSLADAKSKLFSAARKMGIDIPKKKKTRYIKLDLRSSKRQPVKMKLDSNFIWG